MTSDFRVLQGCTEVLCACGELDVGQRDRWNCTPLDVASGDTKEILVNRGWFIEMFGSQIIWPWVSCVNEIYCSA